MSILDNNAVERMNKEAEDGLKTAAAHQPIVSSFRNAFLTLNHAQHIQKWLYDHTLFQTQYESVSLVEYTKTQNIDWETERNGCLQQPIRVDQHLFENGDCIYLPKGELQLMPVMQKSNFSQCIDNYVGIEYELKTIESYMPRPAIAKYASIAVDDSSRSTKYSGNILDVYGRTVLTYPTFTTRINPRGDTSYGGATLFLRGVDYIPSDIAEKDDNGYYHWIMPIKNIYIYDCPNIPQDILDLPYVHTFEEMGWHYWR